jgi:hypothetical protein
MAEKQWFVLNGDRESQPMTSSQLKQLAKAQRITPETKVRLGSDGKWSSAGRVKGLFADPTVAPMQGQLIDAAPRTMAAPESPMPVSAVTLPTRVPCPLCGEEIIETAVKCRHCNEFLDGRPREQPQYQAQPQQAIVMQAAPVNVNVQQVTNVGHGGKRWSPVVAMLLSLLIPGLGQLYKGQAVNGIIWFFAAGVGYVAFILPGLIIHLCCIVGAGTGDPYR